MISFLEVLLLFLVVIFVLITLGTVAFYMIGDFSKSIFFGSCATFTLVICVVLIEAMGEGW